MDGPVLHGDKAVTAFITMKHPWPIRLFVFDKYLVALYSEPCNNLFYIKENDHG